MMFVNGQVVPEYIRWTRGAIECYKRGCVCNGCPTGKIIEHQKCRMKIAVIALVTKFGAPTQEELADVENEEEVKGVTYVMYDKELNLRYPNSIAPIIKAVKEGYTSPVEIEKQTGIKQGNIYACFYRFANHLLKHGLIQQINKSSRQTVVDFISHRLLDPDYVETSADVNNSTIPVDLPSDTPGSETITIKETEYKKLLMRIKELETQPKVDFSEIKTKIQAQITALNTKLTNIEELEEELQLC